MDDWRMGTVFSDLQRRGREARPIVRARNIGPTKIARESGRVRCQSEFERSSYETVFQKTMRRGQYYIYKSVLEDWNVEYGMTRKSDFSG